VLAHPRSSQSFNKLLQGPKCTPRKRVRSDEHRKQDKERKFYLHIQIAPLSGYKNQGAKEGKIVKCPSSPTQANVKRHQEQAKFFAKGVGRANNQGQLAFYKIISGQDITRVQVKSKASCTTASGDVLAVLKTVGTSMGVKQEEGLVEARTASPSKICLDESKSWLQYKTKVLCGYSALLSSTGKRKSSESSRC
jgi:hypothetical protein